MATTKNKSFTYFSIIEFKDGTCFTLKEATKGNAKKQAKKVNEILKGYIHKDVD